MPQTPYHIPAFCKPAVDNLVLNKEGIYVDATFGGGGHSKEILKRLAPYKGYKTLFSFDKDIETIKNSINDKRWQFVHSDFRYLHTFLNYFGINQIDGLLADLGVSFHHFDSSHRGFSFRSNGPLDMRMNQKSKKTAADILASYDKTSLTQILQNYGEIKNAQHYASIIIEARKKNPITTTYQLASILANKPFDNENTNNPPETLSPIFKHTLTCIFQAIRIEVNDELKALEKLLTDSLKIVKKGGTIVFLSYHSLEDRIVKNFLRSGNLLGNIEKDIYGNPLTPLRIIKCPLTPSKQEIDNNPRSRSAKMRVAQVL